MQLLLVQSLVVSVLTVTVAGQNVDTIYIAPIVSNEPNCSEHVRNRCYTLDEVINRQLIQSYQKLTFLHGQHIISGNQISHLLLNEVRYLEFAGQNGSRATIRCKKNFYFHFANAEYIKFSSLILSDCSGQSGGYFNSSHTFYFIDSGEIYFKAISIHNSKESVGIALERIESTVSVNDSEFSTNGVGIGLATYKNARRNSFDLNIFKSVFNGSCIAVEGIQKVMFNLVSSIIERCSCPQVMQFRYLTVDVVLTNITARDNSGEHLIFVYECRYFQFSGFLHFHRNTGGVVISSNTLLVIESAQVEFINSTVLRNSGMPGVPVFIMDSRMFIRSSSVTFLNNRGQHAGGISAQRSSLWFVSAEMSFYSCTGERGGALALYQNSTLEFHSHLSSLSFINNKAQKGGAIYIEDIGYMNLDRELMRSPIIGTSAQFVLLNNTSELGGNQLYGGWIDWLYKTRDRRVHFNGEDISKILYFDPETTDDVSSDPVRVCICESGFPNCNVTHFSLGIYPGETFSIQVVAVGQRFGTAVAVVTPAFVPLNSSPLGRIMAIQNVQVVQRSCSTLQYTVMSPNNQEILQIVPFEEKAPKFDPILLQNHPDYYLLFQTFNINLQLKGCPIGYLFDQDKQTCSCLPLVSSHGLSCDFITYRIRRRAQDWIGTTTIHTLPNKYPGVIIHQYCPNGYCRGDNESLSIQLEHQDQQCSFRRSGILCGKCKTNFSQILGSFKCKECSNTSLLIIIPTVLLAGILLVAFLMVLNLTVSVGTINGLIFYANIIRAQHATYFTPDISNSFLSKFIAWLNLDLGMEACFFNGLDAYTKIWFQFFFPIYIYLIVSFIIVTSHYFTIATRLSGKNAIQVLATLFLLSYTKLLQIIVIVFSFTTITYPNGYTEAVWLYDGNVRFLTGKHLGLFIVTVFVLVILSVPYTVTLVNIQWLLKLSHYRFMFWVTKLMPIFDSYTGPYKANHRYWTGLLLIVRIIALVAFSLNRSNNPSINLLETAVISNALLAYLAITKGIYKSIIYNCLELICLLNLSLTSMAILFDLSNGRRSPAAIFTSTSMALILFTAIVLYHVIQKVLSMQFIQNIKQKLLNIFTQKRKQDDNANEVDLPEDPKIISTTIIDLTGSNELVTPLMND